jgi:MFS family permease
MLLTFAVAGLLVGLLMGGSIEALTNARLRYTALLFAALLIRFGTEHAITGNVPLIDSVRLPLYVVAFACLVTGLWLNRGLPGFLAVMVGVASNGLALILNGGWMPVFMPAVTAAGLGTSGFDPRLHTALPNDLGLPFLLHGGPIGDVIPLPIAIVNNVLSIGDVFIAVGLGWFVFATMLRHHAPEPQSGIALWRGTPHRPIANDRPVMLGGGRGPGLVPPLTRRRLRPTATAEPSPSVIGRIRGHPYLQLARDARFSAFWMGQTVSLFGDRLNQIALGVLVLTSTGSAMQTGLVFLVATLPNLVLGPIAGPFVDRWDQKRVMVASDLLRAGLVVLIPFAARSNILLVYPIVFLVTTVSLFFRPAKSAVVPRIVEPDQLMAANSAVWTGETFADIAGYPLAGLLVAFLGAQIWLAFLLDAMSYIISAALLLTLFIPPVVRAVAPRAVGAVRAFAGELRDGWRVLHRQAALFQNTIVSAVAQLSVGTTLALTIVYSRDVLDGRFIPFPQSYAAIDAAIGIGNLIGGFAVGAIGARRAKGRLVVIGFIVMGLSTVVLGMTQNVLLALGAALVMGIFNLVYIIPTQALFAELVPEGFMGRVIAFRASIVFGSMSLAMAVASIAAERVSAGLIIAASGLITAGAGVVGGLLPAVRDPEGTSRRAATLPTAAALPARAFAEDG